MNLNDNIVYVVCDHSSNTVLDFVYPSVQEAINSNNTAFNSSCNKDLAIYKVYVSDLITFYKHYFDHSCEYDFDLLISKYMEQVYPDPYEGMSIYDLANKGLQWYNEGHYSNDPSARPIYKILKRIIQIF